MTCLAATLRAFAAGEQARSGLLGGAGFQAGDESGKSPGGNLLHLAGSVGEKEAFGTINALLVHLHGDIEFTHSWRHHGGLSCVL